MQNTLTYVPGIGFRQPGVRLAREARAERDGVTLTVTHFTAAPEGGDLTFEIIDPQLGSSCAAPGDPRMGDRDQVSLFDGETEYRDVSRFGVGMLPGGVRHTMRFRTLPSAPDSIELHVKSKTFGDWVVPLELTEYGQEDFGRTFLTDARVEHEGIAIQVRAVSLLPDATAVSFEASAGEGVERIIGVGGMHGMRAGEYELLLRDEQGREYSEQAKHDAREPMERDDLAIFGPVAADANELELVVPFVTVQEAKVPVEIGLPVAEPTAVQLGRYAISVLGSGEAPDSLRRQNFGPALAVRLDLGGWQGDRRVLFPAGVLVDGKDLGMGWGNGINGTRPEPVDTIEVRMPDPTSVKVLTLLAPVTQVRGPWRVRFRIPNPR